MAQKLQTLLSETAAWIASALLTMCSIAWSEGRLAWSSVFLASALGLYLFAFYFHGENGLKHKRVIAGIACLGILVAVAIFPFLHKPQPPTSPAPAATVNASQAQTIHAPQAQRINASQTQTNEPQTQSITVNGVGNQVVAGRDIVVDGNGHSPSSAKRSQPKQ